MPGLAEHGYAAGPLHPRACDRRLLDRCRNESSIRHRRRHTRSSRGFVPVCEWPSRVLQSVACRPAGLVDPSAVRTSQSSPRPAVQRVPDEACHWQLRYANGQARVSRSYRWMPADAGQPSPLAPRRACTGRSVQRRRPAPTSPAVLFHPGAHLLAVEVRCDGNAPERQQRLVHVFGHIGVGGLDVGLGNAVFLDDDARAFMRQADQCIEPFADFS